MAWIESHTVLLRHRKVLQLSADLKIPPVYVIGHLHALWHTVLEQQENGDLTDWSDEMIAQAAAFCGDAASFVASLRARKWLDGMIIHDWIDYAGLYLTKKYSTSNPSLLKSIWRTHGYKYGKRDAKSVNSIANRKRTESEPKANLPNLTRPNLTKEEEIKSYAPVENSTARTRLRNDKQQAKSAETWCAYAQAYRTRYHVLPIRDALTNTHLARLVDRLGREEAPQVAAFYLTLNNEFYVRGRHPPEHLARDAPGLRTQWATGVKATTSETKNAAFKDNVVAQAERVLANLQAREVTSE